MEDVSGGLYMDRAIIIGTFGFLGYSVCRAMLDEGIEVAAIPVDGEHDFSIEEKRMEIGRNANFFEDEVRLRKEEKVEGIIPVIIPYYDFYLIEKEQLLFENDFLLGELLSLPPENYLVTLLLPEQIEYEDLVEMEPLDKLREDLSKNGFMLKEVLVPTLFGPWQPKGCFFQQIFSLGEEKVKVPPTLHPRESTSDAIYVADAASLVRGLLEEAKVGKYVIRSGETNSWYKCLNCIYDSLIKSKEIGEGETNWLKDDLKNMIQSKSSLDQVQKLSAGYKRVYVKEPTAPLEGLDQQRKHYLRILRGKDD